MELNQTFAQSLLFCFQNLQTQAPVLKQMITRLRTLLSMGTPDVENAIKFVKEYRLLPHMINVINIPEEPFIEELIFETAWSLTNYFSYANEDMMRNVVDEGSIPAFVNLFRRTKNLNIKDQALWAIGNIAGHSSICRDYVLSFNILEDLVSLSANTNSISVIRNIAWTISNFTRGKNPCPQLKKVAIAVPVLARFIYTTDVDILSDSLWALHFLSDMGDSKCITMIIEHGICPKLVEYLDHPNISVQCPALRIIGNICTGDDEQTQYIMNLNILNQLKNLLHSKNLSIRKETCWVLSNVAAGNTNQVQQLINHKQIIARLIQISCEDEISAKREALWVLSNIADASNKDQSILLLSNKILLPICNLFTYHKNEKNAIICCLECLNSLLRNIENDKNFHEEAVKVIVQEGGFAALQSLSHDNTYRHDSNVGQLLENLEKHFVRYIRNEDEHVVGLVNLFQKHTI
jgi:hypothetical protein